MIFDGHIHIWNEDYDKKQFFDRLKETGVDGGCVFSIPPAQYMPTKLTPKEKLDIVFDVVDDHEHLYAFYFIDPTEPDALEQVDRALERGVSGFKIICYHFYPTDERAMRVYEKINEAKKPILFHSGILYNPHISSDFNRPCAFEGLLNVKNMKFAMAHVSWPWTDECIALYGKSKNLSKYWAQNNFESRLPLYIDLTPGTPPIYRRDVLTKLCVLFEDTLPNHILFGTDCSVNNYKVDYVKEMMARDNAIYEENGKGQEFKDKIYHQNIMNFMAE
jgi:predicted TIM-barrel fold metal-dependent hydrolase